MPSAVVSASVWQQSIESSDVDEHALAQRHWSLHYDQLSTGRFSGNVRHVQLPGLRLVLEAANCAVRQRGHIGLGDYGFAMTLKQSGVTIFNGQRLDRESIMIGRGNELDLSSPPSFSMIGIVVEGALLNQLWELLYQRSPASWLDRQIVVQARHGAAEEVRATHLRAMAAIAETPGLLDGPIALRMRDAILIDWIEAIPARVVVPELKTVEARKRVVERTCDLMLAEQAVPMTLLEVCARVGASPRKLDYCFREILGTSPSRYLRAVRLNGVRRDLKAAGGPNTNVQDVAAHWGFWHLGDFAADYRRQFCELPSETLGRARRHGG